MSSTPDMPPLPLTWKSRRGNSQIEAPDPNAGRAADYPNKWRVEFNKQTAKCMVCSRSLAGTKWCVVCAKCNKRFCIDCWTGQRFNKYGEKIFEGEAQNLEGCWCRFPTHFDPKWMAESEARTERMQKMIAEERLTTSEEDAQGRVAKRRKLDDDNDDNNDREQSPSSRILHPRDAARLAASGSKKRAALQADPDDEDTEQVRKDSQMPPIDHLEGKTTVVAGAGVIGLSIARELAAQAAASGTEHEIIVVEARDSYAQLASHDCAGLITKHGLPRKLGSLLSTSLAAWEQLLGVEEIREKVRFQQNGVIHVRHKTAGNSEHTAVPPSWYSASETEVFSVHRSDVGKISSRHFAEWLYKECEDFGVQFRFEEEVSAIEKTKQAELQAVDVSSTKEGDNSWTTIPCHNLILAAGPWTPNLLKMLAIWTPDLDNFQQRYEWTRIRRTGLTVNGNVGLMLRSSMYEEGALVVGQATTNEIQIAAVRGEQNNSHVTPTEARATRVIGRQPTSKARVLAKQRVVGFDEEEKTEEEALHMVDGRSLISTSSNQMPLIDKVPAKVLDERHEGEDDSPLGIYLAFGFGRFGTTLAPGVATMLRRMICRDEDEIGTEEAFAFPAKRD